MTAPELAEPVESVESAVTVQDLQVEIASTGMPVVEQGTQVPAARAAWPAGSDRHRACHLGGLRSANAAGPSAASCEPSMVAYRGSRPERSVA